MEIVNKKFHFIAVGGVGMSALAKYLTQRGALVSGSDIQESKYTHLLEDIGVKVYIGHDKNNISEDMIIVASSAIRQSNPEVIRAKELGLKIYHRSDILKMISDEFSKDDNSLFIGFSGTHGKTTTSGLCAYLLEKANYKPSYVVGGIIPEYNTNGTYNDKKYFIAELDESDGTIQKYSTDIAVINNMEEDHLDYYKNGFSDIVETFNKFLSNKPNQKVIINNDNKGNIEFINQYPNYNYITFGINEADYTAKNIKSKGFETEFDVYYKNNKIDTISLCVIGMHNVYNALAVYSVLNEAKIQMKNINRYFHTFTGMGRRFQKVCEFNGIKIYDDYAHHPSEIQTTLNSAKNAKEQNKRLIAVFQPHRYTRLKSLWKEFTQSFNSVDKLIVTDVYSASEDKIDGINSENFAKSLNGNDCTYISGTMEQCAKKIYPMLKDNDILITLGAGDITKLGKLLEQEYKKAI